MSILNLFKRKCPKCGSVNINTIRESFSAQLARYTKYLLFFITILFVKAPPDQYVCKDCGFTWHKM